MHFSDYFSDDIKVVYTLVAPNILMSCNNLAVERMLTAVMSISCISPSASSVYFLSDDSLRPL